MSAHNIIQLPYDQRRIIVVTDRVSAAVASGERPFWFTRLGRSAGDAMGAVTGFRAVSVRTVEMVQEARKRLREVGEKLLTVSSADAEALHFPVGHPRKNAVYIGHPGDPPTYIPVADFHRFLFEHKVAEAQRLIRSLGAVTVEVIRIEGWIKPSVSVLASPFLRFRA
jgi:hypothetical protein